MNTRDTLEGLVHTLPLLPAEAIDSVLESLDLLLQYGDPSDRPWAADAIRQAAASAAHPGAAQRLRTIADTVAAGGKTAVPRAPMSFDPPVAHFQPEPDAHDKPDPEPAASPVKPPKPVRKPNKLSEFKSLNVRKASTVTLGGFKPTFDPLATKFGFHPVALPGEPWPSIDGRPMPFVCQLNLTAAPFVPAILADLRLLTFFLDFSPRKDGDGDATWRFELRAYPTLEGLTPLAPPPGAPALHKGFECKWELADDYPCPEDPGAQNLRDLDTSELDLPNAAQSKIGGWPSLLQSELSWQLGDHPANPEYAFQINSEEKAALSFGDNGTLYLARGSAPGHESEWLLDWQSF